MALRSGDLLLSPCTGWHAGLKAVGQRAVYATTEANRHGSRLGRYVRSTMRSGLCVAFSETAGVRSAVVAQIAV